jgi:hypothetical protein
MKKKLLFISFVFVYCLSFSQIAFQIPTEVSNKKVVIEISENNKNRLLNESTEIMDTRDEVRTLARDLGLMNEISPNIHLSFLDGDISYWTEQRLNKKRLTLEFIARKAVLDAASLNNIIIPTQGDLSYYSQQIIGKILEKLSRQ